MPDQGPTHGDHSLAADRNAPSTPSREGIPLASFERMEHALRCLEPTHYGEGGLAEARALSPHARFVYLLAPPGLYLEWSWELERCKTVPTIPTLSPLTSPTAGAGWCCKGTSLTTIPWKRKLQREQEGLRCFSQILTTRTLQVSPAVAHPAEHLHGGPRCAFHPPAADLAVSNMRASVIRGSPWLTSTLVLPSSKPLW